jgi:transposase
MAKAYSDDLRRKLLGAHDRGESSLAELAQRFGVSVPWAWKISRQRRRTGQTERVEQRHGPPSRILAEVQASLRGLVRQQPDATLVELQQGLWARERVGISFQHLWRVLQKLGLRLKKSHSTRKNKNKRRPRSKPAGRGGGRR